MAHLEANWRGYYGTEHGGDLSHQCYVSIRRALVRGEFPAGTLILETALSRELGVSRTPVREALNYLERDGFLIRLTRGYRVQRASAGDIVEFYEARIALEANVVASAALRRTTFDLSRIRAVHERMVNAPDEEALLMTTEFHRAIWHSSHNAILTNMLEQIADLVHLFDPTPVKRTDNLQLIAGEHEQILSAIERHDSEFARRSLVQHMTRSRDLRVQALLGSGSDDPA